MRRGTTPIHEFDVPFEKADIKSAKIVYSQEDQVILCKKTHDCSVEDGRITVRLSQEETLRFNCNKTVQIQVRILTLNDDAFTSDPITVLVSECLDGEVIE